MSSANTADFGLTDSSSISQRLSGSMNRGMNRIKKVNWGNVVIYVLALVIIGGVASLIYKNEMKRRKGKSTVADSARQCTRPQASSQDDQEDQLGM